MTIGETDPSKLHPLSDHALERLTEIFRAPVPTLEINAGVLDRFRRERLVDVIELKSPFKTHNGRLIPHAKITDAGIRKLGLEPAVKPIKKKAPRR